MACTELYRLHGSGAIAQIRLELITARTEGTALWYLTRVRHGATNRRKAFLVLLPGTWNAV